MTQLNSSAVVLIIGSGGREQALAYKLAESADCRKVLIAPGNGGSNFIDKVENVQADIDDFEQLTKIAVARNVEFTVVGSELPLVEGIVDFFQARQLPIIGPNQYAAQLEGSKDFCKQFLTKYKIPTASYQTFDDLKSALSYIDTRPAPYVIKADGLAAGKGVIIAEDSNTAKLQLSEIMTDKVFGNAGNKVVIESFLQGEEASFIVLISDGQVIPMITSQDHKNISEGDKGLNTGGMGAYAPASIVTTACYQKILNSIVTPTINGFKQENIDYCGFLYIGLMIANNGDPSVVEFNCRFGDPEAQPVLSMLASDFYQMLKSALLKDLANYKVNWYAGSAVGVVLASKGYPKAYPKGEVITGIDKVTGDTIVFHSGTKVADNKVLTNGGRVLCVTTKAKNLQSAIAITYEQIAKIHWQNIYFRKDIGFKGES